MKLILEKWNKFLINETNKKIDIEKERIYIANKIHDYLMQPTVNIGDKYDTKYVWDDEGNRQEVPMTKQDSTFLLYLYKGFDEEGKLSNEQDISAVNSQINHRIEIFIDSLTEEQKIIFKEDTDNIIEYMKKRRTQREEDDALTRYIGKKAPGLFKVTRFASRHRALYSDTNIHGGNPDFMFKNSPELKNIPEEHHFLFSVENLIGRASNSITTTQVSTIDEVPELSAEEFFANYVEGITMEHRQSELDMYRPLHQRSSIEKVRVRLELGSLIYFYPDKIEDFLSRLQRGEETGTIVINNTQGKQTKQDITPSNFESYTKYSVSEIVEYTENTIAKLRPENFQRLLFLIDGGHLPKKYYSHEEKSINALRVVLDKKKYPRMSYYEIIYPFDPSQVPKEDQLHPDDLKKMRERAISKFENIVKKVKNKIVKNLGITPQDIDDLENLFAKLYRDQKKQGLSMLQQYDVSEETIRNAILKYKQSSPIPELSGYTDEEEDEDYFDPALEAKYILDEIISIIEAGEEMDDRLIDEYNSIYDTLSKQQQSTLKPQLNTIRSLLKRGER